MAEMIGIRETYGETLRDLGGENKDIVVLDADLSGSTKTSLFAKEYPERFFNMGVSEQDMITTAAGLAAAGKIPFASSFAIFATGKAFEQVRQSVAYTNLNVKIVSTHAGVTVGEDGGSHQAIEDLALMRTLPNMTVLTPADAEETRQIIRKIVEYQGPVYVRGARNKYPVIFDDSYKFEIGKAAVLSEGKDATIIACGFMVSQAKEACEILKEKGKDVGLINMSSIKPIDKEAIIKAAKATNAIITAEEHSVIGGLGSAVCEVLSENYPCKLKRVGLMDTFGKSGPANELVVKFGLAPSDIVKATLELIS
ncbi:transketolase family protein [Thermodesulfobacteriota bacterium]